MEGLLSILGTIVVPLFLAVAVLAALASVARWWKRVGPNEAMIVYGRGKTRIVTGGGSIVVPVLEQAERMSLRLMTLEVKDDNVITGPGVELLLNWIAQVQIAPDTDSILTAARAFLGKREEEIRQSAQNALSGNFREVVATMTPEEIHAKKETFAQQVRTLAEPEMKGLGLMIVALTIQEINDRVGYFKALGAPRIAEVQKAAQIAEAEAKRDARIKAAAAEEAAASAEAEAATRKAEAQNAQRVREAELKAVADAKKAEADVAYETTEAALKKGLVLKQGEAETERQRQAALAAEQAVEVAQRLKQAEIVVPAETARQAAELEAQGAAKATTLKAGAEAEAERLKGQSTADATRAIGEAEAAKTQAALLAQAEGEERLAQARAAMEGVNLQLEVARMMFEAQVKIAAEYAGALAGIGANMKVVQFSGGSADGQQGNLLLQTLMQIPELAAVLNEKTLALAGADVPTIIARVAEMLKGVKAGTGAPEAKA